MALVLGVLLGYWVIRHVIPDFLRAYWRVKVKQFHVHCRVWQEEVSQDSREFTAHLDNVNKLRMLKVQRFQLVYDKSGKVDKSSSVQAYTSYIGCPNAATALDDINQNSYSSGTALDHLYGDGESQQEVFRKNARRAGFNDNQIEAYLMISPLLCKA